jgi:ATP-dependent RNA helicase DeaD
LESLQDTPQFPQNDAFSHFIPIFAPILKILLSQFSFDDPTHCDGIFVFCMTTFSELGLKPELLRAVEEMGFETPTPIQAETIPLLTTAPCDIVGLAQTGTGKTAAFGLPALHLIDGESRLTQVLILSPTRELCVQITKELTSFAKHLRGLQVTAVYGGASISGQIKELRHGSQVVVATPGRLNDLLARGAVDLTSIQVVVLDEADEMLNMGFQEDLDLILSTTPEDKNTWLFSATMPPGVRKIAKNYMTDPVEITTGNTTKGAENIRHLYYQVMPRDRYNALKRILDFSPEFFGIIFCRTKIETQEVAEKLIRDGYNADALHGDLSQIQRDKVMARFRDRSLNALVATDVAARGIDVNDITHVVHFNLPDDLENYTHRSGRTARAGKSGVSLSLVTHREVGRIRNLERALNRKFLREPVPSGEEVCEMKLMAWIKQIQEVKVDEQAVAAFVPRILEQFAEMSQEDLIKRIVSLQFHELLKYYSDAPDLNGKPPAKHDGQERYVSGQRIFLNVGKTDGYDRSELLKFVCEVSGLPREAVGRIDVRSIHSYFEVERHHVEQLLNSFLSVRLRGRPLRIDTASPDQGTGGSEGGGSYGGGGYGGGQRPYKKKEYRKEGGGEPFWKKPYQAQLVKGPNEGKGPKKKRNEW